MRDAVLAHPSVQRLKRVAIALGEISREVVFIGGSIAPLLQVDPPFEKARETKDADGVIASSRYSELTSVGEMLLGRGFSRSFDHVHRWYSHDGDMFDLMLAGHHLGGSGSRWDAHALKTNVETDVGDGLFIRHADAPAFLGLKWAAYQDRGALDPLGSHDLEDILALIASRPAIVSEVERSPIGLCEFIAAKTDELIRDQFVEDLLAGHLNNAEDQKATIDLVRARLVAIAEGGRGNPTLG